MLRSINIPVTQDNAGDTLNPFNDKGETNSNPGIILINNKRSLDDYVKNMLTTNQDIITQYCLNETQIDYIERVMNSSVELKIDTIFIELKYRKSSKEISYEDLTSKLTNYTLMYRMRNGNIWNSVVVGYKLKDSVNLDEFNNVYKYLLNSLDRELMQNFTPDSFELSNNIKTPHRYFIGYITGSKRYYSDRVIDCSKLDLLNEKTTEEIVKVKDLEVNIIFNKEQSNLLCDMFIKSDKFNDKNRRIIEFIFNNYSKLNVVNNFLKAINYNKDINNSISNINYDNIISRYRSDLSLSINDYKLLLELENQPNNRIIKNDLNKLIKFIDDIINCNEQLNLEIIKFDLYNLPEINGNKTSEQIYNGFVVTNNKYQYMLNKLWYCTPNIEKIWDKFQLLINHFNNSIEDYYVIKVKELDNYLIKELKDSQYYIDVMDFKNFFNLKRPREIDGFKMKISDYKAFLNLIDFFKDLSNNVNNNIMTNIVNNSTEEIEMISNENIYTVGEHELNIINKADENQIKALKNYIGYLIRDNNIHLRAGKSTWGYIYNNKYYFELKNNLKNLNIAGFLKIRLAMGKIDYIDKSYILTLKELIDNRYNSFNVNNELIMNNNNKILSEKINYANNLINMSSNEGLQCLLELCEVTIEKEYKVGSFTNEIFNKTRLDKIRDIYGEDFSSPKFLNILTGEGRVKSINLDYIKSLKSNIEKKLNSKPTQPSVNKESYNEVSIKYIENSINKTKANNAIIFLNSNLNKIDGLIKTLTAIKEKLDDCILRRVDLSLIIVDNKELDIKENDYVTLLHANINKTMLEINVKIDDLINLVESYKTRPDYKEDNQLGRIEKVIQLSKENIDNDVVTMSREDYNVLMNALKVVEKLNK